jgi:chromosome segregation ATPase
MANAPKDKFDPRAVQLVESWINTGEVNEQQRQQIEHLQIEIEKLQARCKYADNEIKRVARARDQFAAQYCELKIQLEVIVTTAVDACDQAKIASQNVIERAKAALAACQSELVRAGVEEPLGDAVELTLDEQQDARELAFKFKPRKPKEELPAS